MEIEDYKREIINYINKMDNENSLKYIYSFIKYIFNHW